VKTVKASLRLLTHVAGHLLQLVERLGQL